MAGPPVADSKPLGVVFIHVALICDMTEAPCVLHCIYISEYPAGMRITKTLASVYHHRVDLLDALDPLLPASLLRWKEQSDNGPLLCISLLVWFGLFIYLVCLHFTYK